MKFTILIHEAEEGGYWVEVPTLPGCFAQGETRDEVIEDARAAIQSHLEALQADGQPIPESDAPAELATVEVG